MAGNRSTAQMATPGQLVECVLRALCVQKPTVALHDRNLSEAGLRSKGGRGPSAIAVSSVDAVNLLIATIASPIIPGPSTLNSAAVCKFYGGLQGLGTRGGFVRWSRNSLPKLAAL